MILCGDKTVLGGGGGGAGGGCPPGKEIKRREERAGRVKNKYVTISDGAYVAEGSLSDIGTLPPHNSDIPHIPGASNTHKHTQRERTWNSAPYTHKST